jgi:hypothetical protein
LDESAIALFVVGSPLVAFESVWLQANKIETAKARIINRIKIKLLAVQM